MIDYALFNRCLSQLEAHRPINQRRSAFYEGKALTRHMAIAVPPQMRAFETVVGWPAKAVDVLEGRIDLDGFNLPKSQISVYGLDKIWTENRLAVEASHVHTTALKYGCAFLAITKGNPGEPAALIRPLSPLNATIIWDKNTRRAAAGLAVHQWPNPHTEQPFRATLFTTTDVIEIENDEATLIYNHGLGRVPMALIAFKPSLEDPFGRSRISQSVMGITARVTRTLLRTEVAAEFYAAPQRYILGAEEDDFKGSSGEKLDRFTAAISRIWAFSRDDDGHLPEVGQLPQINLQSHTDMLRSDAALFAGETDIPVNVLGIIHDNPASDAAMHTAYLTLDKTAERAGLTFGAGWVEAMQLAWRVANGGKPLPDELHYLTAKYRDPSTPTQAAMAQSVAALVQTGVLPPDSEITYELLGYDAPLVARLTTEAVAARASKTLRVLEQMAGPADPPPA